MERRLSADAGAAVFIWVRDDAKVSLAGDYKDLTVS
jgi:hypothetical protein